MTESMLRTGCPWLIHDRKVGCWLVLCSSSRSCFGHLPALLWCIIYLIYLASLYLRILEIPGMK